MIRYYEYAYPDDAARVARGLCAAGMVAGAATVRAGLGSPGDGSGQASLLAVDSARDPIRAVRAAEQAATADGRRPPWRLS